MVSNILFSPRTLGKWSNLSNIFQMGWFNHQLTSSGLSRQLSLWIDSTSCRWGVAAPQAVASSALGTELKQVEVPWVSLRSSEVVTRCFLGSLKWCFFFLGKKQDVMVGKGLKFWCLLSCFYLNRNESDMMLCDSIMTWCWGYLAGLALLGSLGSLLKAGIRVLNRPPVKSNKCKFRGSKLLPVSWNNQDASTMQPW